MDIAWRATVPQKGDFLYVERRMKMGSSNSDIQIWGKEVDIQMPRSKTDEQRAEALVVELTKLTEWKSGGPEILRAAMDGAGATQDDLFVEMRRAGWESTPGKKGSYSTLGRILRGDSEPSAIELGLIARIVAGYADNWSKASNLSSPQAGDDFRSPRVVLVPAAAGP